MSETEERRLWSPGLSEDVVRRGLVAWVAADVGVDADELAAEWERESRRWRWRHGG